VQNRFASVVSEMFDKGIRLEDARMALERQYIERALAQTDGSLTKAASLLGLHRNTLSRKLAELRRAAHQYERGR
jgi:DNA-binding NtrC family response regulator